MARYPLFATGQKGATVHRSAQRRLNLYAEFQQDGDRGGLTFKSTPGLTLFGSFGAEPVRGAETVGNLMYVVHRGTLYSVNNAAVKTSLGTLTTVTGRVDMTNNGTELMLVDGTNGYIWETVAETFTTITDGDFPDTVDTVDFQGGRFVFQQAGSGSWGISASYDGTAYDATEFATAESFPDDLVRIYVDHNEVLLFGDASTEFWGNVGALDFPYAPIAGAVVEWGLAARWSVARLNSTVAFLAKNREGQVSVMMVAGYQPQRISTDEIDYLFNKYSTVSDAQAFAYRVSGHSFYQITFPTAAKSWLFDVNSGLWSELEYASEGARHRAEFGVEFLNKTIAFDYENGNMYTISADEFTDNGVAIVREIIGRHIFDEETISIGRLWLDVETGLGDSPQAMLSISRDGGHTYGPERWASLGAVGEYLQRVIWRTLGQAYDFVVRIRIAGATRCTITGAWVDAA
jgi:hypothetical protein